MAVISVVSRIVFSSLIYEGPGGQLDTGKRMDWAQSGVYAEHFFGEGWINLLHSVQDNNNDCLLYKYAVTVVHLSIAVLLGH